MKITVRNVYLTEFAEMSYFQRLFYLLAQDVKYDLPNPNPLDWCIRDIWITISLLGLGAVAWVLFPLPAYLAYKLKTRYADSGASTYIPNQRIIE